jgi:uncharacterized cysteine cluster protein YcgN (CxxCxxCC family)
MNPQPAFLQKPLDQMTHDEWESICDGCALCCQIRVEDVDSGEIALSNAACRYLCLSSHACTDYENRLKNVPDCTKVTPENIHDLSWLPHQCSYRVVAAGGALPDWHHLICGDKNAVHQKGPSMRGELINENDAEWEE